MSIPVYNSRIPNMPKPPRLSRAACLLVVTLSLFSQRMAKADDWSAGQQQLAAKIVAVTGPGAVAVDIENRSSLSKNDVDAIRRGLLADLSFSGVRLVATEQAAATVKVSLSEDLRSYVWIAEIHQGEAQSSVVLITLSRPEAPPTPREAPALAIRKTLLWQSADRILDVAIMSGSSHMVVLYPHQVILYKMQDGRWQAEQSMTINHARPWPRDLRGRLVLRKDHLFDAYLPGVFCQSTAAVPLGLSCRESDDPWPIGTEQLAMGAFYAPSRNFFTGALSPGIGTQRTAPAFYSAAALPRQNYTLWLLASADGSIHLLDGMTDQTAPKLGWGSDIATLHSGCGTGWQVLATSNVNDSGDSVRAFEVADREALAVGQPVEFAGGVIALWAAFDGNTVVAITRNVETDRYEAFQLNISCGQ